MYELEHHNFLLYSLDCGQLLLLHSRNCPLIHVLLTWNIQTLTMAMNFTHNMNNYDPRRRKWQGMGLHWRFSVCLSTRYLIN